MFDVPQEKGQGAPPPMHAPLPFRTSLPVTWRPYPVRARGILIPMPRHPDRIHTGPIFPMPRQPDPMRIGPRPITRNPRLLFIQRRSSYVHLRRRRFFRRPDCRRPRDRFSRSHRSTPIATGATAREQTPYQRQYAKNYSLHNFLPSGRFSRSQFKRFLIAIGNICPDDCEGQWGRVLLEGEVSLAEPFILEIFRPRATFLLCQSTSFTAKNAAKTAKSWSAELIGKALSVLNAARRNSKRNFQFSPLPALPPAPLPREK